MKKQTTLAVVKHDEVRERIREQIARQDREWKELKDRCRISADELQSRVRHLRSEFERYRAQVDAVAFDICDGDVPVCLDDITRKYLIDLVEGLNPLTRALFEASRNRERPSSAKTIAISMTESTTCSIAIPAPAFISACWPAPSSRIHQRKPWTVSKEACSA